MQLYHLEVEGIPEYTNMIEDAQKQAGRAGYTIIDKTLLLFASMAMLATERYLQTNDDWEDTAEEHKTWAGWKSAYKRAHAKARVKALATKGSDKFGATNAAEKVLKTSKLETNNGGDEVGMKALEGYFDNLAAAPINDKSVRGKLVANNSKLTATNKNLVVIVKKLSNKMNNLERKTSRRKKTSGIGALQGKRDPTLCPHCKKEGYRAPDACFELAQNKEKRPPGWKIWL